MTMDKKHLADLRRRHAAQGVKLRKAEEAAGVRPRTSRGGGWNEKTLKQHVADGTYREDRHGPKPVVGGVHLEPKPEHLPPELRTVDPRWIRTPMDEWCAANGYWFDERFAEHFRDFGRNNLKFWEGSQWIGKPFELMDWQYNGVFAPLMGWFRVHPDHKIPVRRHTEAYVQVAKKNGKSPSAAYLGTYMTTAENEAGGHVFSTAKVLKQARIVHEHAVRMVRASPSLASVCKIHRSALTITHEPSGVTYQPLASEAGTSEGLNGHCCIIDELHAWGSTGEARYNELVYMFASRVSPILFVITTAGDDIQGVCGQQYEYSKAVASGGIHAPEHLSFIAEADKGDDPGDPTTWAKANPSLGVTVHPAEIEAAYLKAARKPGTLAAFRKLRCNQWVEAANPWLDMEHWRACQDNYSWRDMVGETCYAGLDLSKTRDTTALTLTFPWEDGWRQVAFIWLPEETIAESKHLVDYVQWVKDGHLMAVPGSTIDYTLVEDTIVWADETFDLRGVHYDPYRAASMMQRLTAETGMPSTEFPQTIIRFAEPMEEFERGVLRHNLRHDGNPVLTWMAANVQCREDMNRNKRPVKPVSQDVRKIDGIVAAVMGLSLAMSDNAISQYEDDEEDLDDVEWG